MRASAAAVIAMPARRVGVRRSGEERLFAAATAIIAAHLALTGVVHAVRGERAIGIAALLAVALAPLLWRDFTAGGRFRRTAIAAGLGVAAAAIGLAVHGVHAALAGPGPMDATGLPAALAGLALVTLAFRLALRGRRRLVQVLAGVPAAFVLLQWAAVPMLGAGLATNAGHPPIPPARTLGLAGARDVTFAAADGTRLAGWYIPGRTHMAVVLMHGSHGSRLDTAAHLRMLARAGFGVLAFDARGHGQSTGAANALGWDGAGDVAGALAFVRRQPGVDARRIGAVGLSMGGEEALRSAAGGAPLAAVVADGAGASTLGDQRLVLHGARGLIATSTAWMSFRETELLSGDHEPAPLADIVARIRQPVLLIASGATDERAIDREFARRIGPRAALWYLADAGHTGGLARHPARYAQRVTRFLALALGSARR